jgi:hypothetical protein
MMAEARSEWTCMVDGDEIYSGASIELIKSSIDVLQAYHEKEGLLYGMVPRVEVQGDLKTAYGVGEKIPHHRLYHCTAIFGGSHPGEYQVYEGRGKNQMWLPKEAVCWHFHGALRSPKDSETHGRLDRKNKPTYLRGTKSDIDLFKELPILRTKLGFTPNPVLVAMQEEQK